MRGGGWASPYSYLSPDSGGLSFPHRHAEDQFALFPAPGHCKHIAASRLYHTYANCLLRTFFTLSKCIILLSAGFLNTTVHYTFSARQRLLVCTQKTKQNKQTKKPYNVLGITILRKCICIWFYHLYRHAFEVNSLWGACWQYDYISLCGLLIWGWSWANLKHISISGK